MVPDGDWKYAKLTDGGIAILGYSGTDINIDLTALDFGGNIVNIGGSAFEYSAVESIRLPETLITIQARAFLSRPCAVFSDSTDTGWHRLNHRTWRSTLI